ncbi:hypothetical protein NDU88_001076 [Pleurodeles waltl]|uniref:Secreted protein n=1 Tax=Pleurodeles waltl TaxID=8319 RepID=A0AAV7P5Y3_PLEWA|nr:hypothetical protein NDU88_001076 [Pleurodeles waltl]
MLVFSAVPVLVVPVATTVSPTVATTAVDPALPVKPVFACVVPVGVFRKMVLQAPFHLGPTEDREPMTVMLASFRAKQGQQHWRLAVPGD